MRFEDLANRAGKAAAEVGRKSNQPSFARMLVRQHRRRQVTAGATLGVVVLAVLAGSQLTSGHGPVAPSATTSSLVSTTSTGHPTTTTTIPVTTTLGELLPVAREECPVTVSGATPFTPVDETPQPPPPDSFQASWYGTTGLWTFVYDAGQVWDGLPITPGGTRTQITMWWSQNLDISTEPTPEISVTADHILGSPSTRIQQGRVTTGSNPEMGTFALVRLDFPHDGCWEITAEYEGAMVTYIAWVAGRDS